VGKTKGRWLDESDFVFCGEDHADDLAADIGPHRFPRDWPDVYESSEALKSLLRRKGPCPAKRVSVVASPTSKDQSLLKDFTPLRLQSFTNAETMKASSGLDIVEGWAIYDLFDDVTGAAFVAEKYWWNKTADGEWIDFTPHPENVQEMLLAESVNGVAKPAGVLTQSQFDLAERLFSLRFPRAKANSLKAAARQQPSSALADSDELKTAVKRVRLGITDAVTQTLKNVEKDRAIAIGLVEAGMCAALVSQLLNTKNSAAAVRLLALIATVAMENGQHETAARSLLQCEGVAPLVELLAFKDIQIAVNAATVLGHACFHAPQVQDQALRAGAARRLVNLLKKNDARCFSEALYALWHLQVGHREHAEAALSAGAAPLVVSLLTKQPDIVRLNAAGAIMQLATAPGGQDALAQENAVQTLCELFVSEPDLRLREQFTGALLNLLQGHEGNCNKAREDLAIIKPLVMMIGTGPLKAREYAAGVFANLVSKHPAEILSAAAVEAGVVPALMQLSQKSRRNAEVYGAIANLSMHLTDDERQEIFVSIADRLVASLADHSSLLHKEALSMCMNFASSVQVKQRFMKAGTLNDLIIFLRDPDDETRERAAGAVANLINGHIETIAKAHMQCPELAGSIVGMLNQEHIPIIRRHLARCLAIFTSREASRAAVRHAGAMEVLVSCLELDQIGETAVALMNFASNKKDRDDLVALGVVPPLVQLLQHPHLISQGYAAGALANLTVGSQEIACKVASAGAVPHLVSTLQSAEATSEIAEWAAGALGNLAEYAGADVRRKIMDASGVSALIKVLVHGEGTGQELAVFALGALADSRAADLRAPLLSAADALKAVSSRCDGQLKFRAEMLRQLIPRIA